MTDALGRVRWLGLLAILLPAAACDDSPTGPGPGMPAVVRLQVGQSAVVGSAGGRVRFVDVEQDSRCPTSVVCVWEGEGVVRVELSSGGTVMGSPSLSTHLTGGSSPNSVRVDRYTLRLVQLDPYPESTEPIPRSSYRLTLQISY